MPRWARRAESERTNSERIRAAAVEQATALMRRLQESERQREAAARALSDLQAQTRQSSESAHQHEEAAQAAAQRAEAEATEARNLARRHEEELARMAAHWQEQEQARRHSRCAPMSALAPSVAYRTTRPAWIAV